MASKLASSTAKKASLSKYSSSSLLKYAVGGWTFFIAENYILSENRTYIIQDLLQHNEEKYHAIYGTLSTIAMASIGYGYHKIRNATLNSNSTAKATTTIVKLPRAVAAWTCMSLALIMASQAMPKLQIPVAIVHNNSNNNKNDNNHNNNNHGIYNNDIQPPAPSTSTPPVSWNLQVRCPFDFTDKRSSTADANSNNSDIPVGLQRISRHPGLWSFAFIGLAFGCVAPNLYFSYFYMGPTFVALIGGNHTDSRFRRNMGGTLSPGYDSKTSNLPFWAIISGQQGSSALSNLLAELKPLNAGIAVMASGMWILRKVVR